MSPDLPGLLVALAITLVASVYDLRERRIPNWLILCGLAAAGVLTAVTGNWPDRVAGGLLAVVALLLPRIVMRGSVGAGDVKLATSPGKKPRLLSGHRAPAERRAVLASVGTAAASSSRIGAARLETTSISETIDCRRRRLATSSP